MVQYIFWQKNLTAWNNDPRCPTCRLQCLSPSLRLPPVVIVVRWVTTFWARPLVKAPWLQVLKGFCGHFFFAFRLQSTLGFCDWEHWGCTKTGFGGCCIDGHDYAEMIDHASPPSSRPTAPLLRCALCNLMPKFCVPHSQSQEHLAKSSLDVTSSPVKEWLSRFSRTLGEDERNYGVQARSGRLHRQLRSFLCVCQNRLNIHQVLNTSGKCFFLIFLWFCRGKIASKRWRTLNAWHVKCSF